jgi:ribosomal protein S25
VVTSNGHVYAYFRCKNWESPIVYGQSKCAYVSGVYAFDQNGTLLWNKTISPGAYSMGVAGNGTIFYRTGDGRLVVTGAGAATGFALTTLAYIFIRFLCLGAVARAKARMSKNSNSYSRDQQLILSLLKRDTMGKILGLLARRPGISNVEIAGEVGIPESITSRYLKELSEKGVVRNSSSGRERAYSIDDAYGGYVADAIKRLQGQ